MWTVFACSKQAVVENNYFTLAEFFCMIEQSKFRVTKMTAVRESTSDRMEALRRLGTPVI